MFISRAVLAGAPIPLDRPVIFSNMPVPHPSYVKSFPGRVVKFPASTELVIVSPPEVCELPPFQHLLRHDAESIYILLLYWSIHIRPENDQHPEARIPNSFWGPLHSDRPDGKVAVFHSVKKDPFHPQYSGLHELLGPMGALLEHDYYWAPEGPMKDPEYVHEALQRLLFNFMVEHDRSSFMDLAVAAHQRRVERLPMTTESFTPSVTHPRISRHSTSMSIHNASPSHRSGNSTSSKRKSPPDPSEDTQKEVFYFVE